MLHFLFSVEGNKRSCKVVDFKSGPVLFAGPEARLYNDWTGHTMVTDSSAAAI